MHRLPKPFVKLVGGKGLWIDLTSVVPFLILAPRESTFEYFDKSSLWRFLNVSRSFQSFAPVSFGFSVPSFAAI
jgi:hypothetical protein